MLGTVETGDLPCGVRTMCLTFVAAGVHSVIPIAAFFYAVWTLFLDFGYLVFYVNVVLFVFLFVFVGGVTNA